MDLVSQSRKRFTDPSLAALAATALLAIPLSTTAKDRVEPSFAYDTIQYSIGALLGPSLPPDAYSAVANAPFLALDSLEHTGGAATIDLIVLTGALRLDAALSEEQNCVILRLGAKVLPSLERAASNPEGLVDECRKRAISAGVSAASVCVAPSVVRDRAARQIEALSKHAKCDE